MDAARTLKRFYRTASVEAAAEGWRIVLDGRPVRTPAGAALALPVAALAEAIAAEWDGQGDQVEIEAMTLTRLANVAIDRTPSSREALATEVRRYCETDLVCHLAEGPAELRECQEAHWAGLRAWAGRARDIVLVPVAGVIAAPQPDASLDAAERHAAGLDDFQLTGLAFGCGLLGSAVIALALQAGEIDGAAAFAASRVDEDYQAGLWGRDEEAEAAAARRRAEALALDTWFTTLRHREGSAP